MSRRIVPVVLALVTVLCGTAGRALAEESAIGTIKGPTFDQAKVQALSWLSSVKADAATLQQAEALWNPAVERPLLDRVAETLLLGDPQARELITMLRNPTSPSPTGVPDFLKDAGRPQFLRANLGLYFARQLATRRTYEETLDALKLIRPEQVVDPASYYFFKGVAENKLRMKEAGLASVNRLINSIPDAPERYTVLANLMKAEMEQWENDDLGDIARRMHEVEDRLEIARGGPKTQLKQKEILELLDKKIEDLEKQCNCQGGGATGSAKPNMPAGDSRILLGKGDGKIDKKNLAKTAEAWGKMPEKERIKALEAISREYPPHYREAIEGYLREMAKAKSGSEK